MIDRRDRQRLQDMRARAERNVLDVAALRNPLTKDHGLQDYANQVAQQTVTLPTMDRPDSVHVALLVERHAVGVVRHMWILMVDSFEVPQLPAITRLAEILGFTGAANECDSFQEALPQGIRLHLMQPVAPSAGNG